MKKIQTISRENLQLLYKTTCDEWRSIIKDILAEQMTSDKLNVQSELVNKAYSEANASQKELLERFFEVKETSKIDKIKNFEDILKIAGKTLEEVIPWRYAKNKAQTSQNAYAKLQLITEVYNEGHVINWNNSNEYKWAPFLQKALGGGWLWNDLDYFRSFGYCGFGLFYKTKELGQDAVRKFMDIYNDYLPE